MLTYDNGDKLLILGQPFYPLKLSTNCFKSLDLIVLYLFNGVDENRLFFYTKCHTAPRA